MAKDIVKYQYDVLKALSGRIDDFYLAGGTALGLFYFQHRLSVDLDFFSRSFDYKRVKETIEYLKKTFGKKIDPLGRNLDRKTAQIAVYNIHFRAGCVLKIDFVEDVVDLLKKTKALDGINVLSLEDIYLRKLYALAGMIRTLDETGRGRFAGGRTSAKDFYDVYYLSHTFMPLSRFIQKYCDQIMAEAVVRWYRTFDRMAMIDGILGLDTSRPVDYKAQEKHFKDEIDRIVDLEIGGL